jgi:hypothetical protein
MVTTEASTLPATIVALHAVGAVVVVVAAVPTGPGAAGRFGDAPGPGVGEPVHAAAIQAIAASASAGTSRRDWRRAVPRFAV